MITQSTALAPTDLFDRKSHFFEVKQLASKYAQVMVDTGWRDSVWLHAGLFFAQMPDATFHDKQVVKLSCEPYALILRYLVLGQVPDLAVSDLNIT